MAYQTALDTPLRIAHFVRVGPRGLSNASIAFLPLGSAINRVPHQSFQR